MNIHIAKKWPLMVVTLSFMRDIHFETVFTLFACIFSKLYYHELPSLPPLTFIQPKYPMNSNMVKIGTIRSGVCLLKGSTVENEIFKCGKASLLLNSSGTSRYCDPKSR
jgi:hypothetical protein